MIPRSCCLPLPSRLFRKSTSENMYIQIVVDMIEIKRPLDFQSFDDALGLLDYSDCSISN